MASPLFAIARRGAGSGKLAAPDNVAVTVQPDPDSQNWDATFDAVPGADHYEYLVDNNGSWTTAAGSPLTGSNTVGPHLLLVRAVKSGGQVGNIGVSNLFELT